MGNIYRQVKLCGLTPDGKKRGCVEAQALVDTGATKTVVSEAIGEQLKVPNIKLPHATTLNDRPVKIKLAGVELAAPRCQIEALVVAVDDQSVQLAGKAPNGKPVEVILGHDYLQNQHAALQYKSRGDSISCRPSRKKR